MHFVNARLTKALMTTRHQREACVTRLHETHFAEDNSYLSWFGRWRTGVVSGVVIILLLWLVILGFGVLVIVTVLRVWLGLRLLSLMIRESILFLRLSILCLFPHFPLLHFLPLRSGAVISTPAFSAPPFRQERPNSSSALLLVRSSINISMINTITLSLRFLLHHGWLCYIIVIGIITLSVVTTQNSPETSANTHCADYRWDSQVE